MASARLSLMNLHHKLSSASSFPFLQIRLSGGGLRTAASAWGSRQGQSWGNKAPVRLMATAEEKNPDSNSNEVAVSRRSRLFPRLRRGRRSPWRAVDRDLAPPLYDFFPSTFGNALLEATENMNRLFDSLDLMPWQLTARVREEDDHYKLRYDVPGLSKEDVKITVDDGVLIIKGERREEKEDGGEGGDEYWAARSYGYYNARVALPEDAKVDEIKAEMKDGVLTVTVPKTEKAKKDVKEITIN